MKEEKAEIRTAAGAGEKACAESGTRSVVTTSRLCPGAPRLNRQSHAELVARS